MKVYLNEVSGIADAIISMYFSKRSWTRELEESIRNMVNQCTDRRGFYLPECKGEKDRFLDSMGRITKWGVKHITLLRFIDFSFTVEGLHRAGQDDWDAHAYRYNNRIIRASTRDAIFDGTEMSEWYQGKILPMDAVLDIIETPLPETITKDGVEYTRTTNGYIRTDLKDDKNVKRGLYMECIPSNFIFRVNLTDWAHVYKERNINGGAHPEVKKLCETCADLLYEANPYFTRELFLDIKN